jgi:ABC-type transporter Mla maintaining outer membrane lipid asymmetry ATPase subunit MlaF
VPDPSASADPLIAIDGLEKASPGLPTLRVRRLVVRPGDRFTIRGIDAGASEALVHLMTGAALPDKGEVRMAGRRTTDVGTDMEWLTSLDRFGIVTARAVLLDGLSRAANLALPMTLDVDPIPAEIRQRVADVARLVGLDEATLDAPAVNLAPLERMRMHLARALAVDPQALLLEHPTIALDPAASRAFGEALRRAADARGLAWVAFADDDAFAEAAGGRRGRLDLSTGEWKEDRPGFWRRLWPNASR